MPTTSMLSLSSTGMPCSGPRTFPALRSASSASASAIAAGVDLDDRIQRGPASSIAGDAIEIGLRERTRRQRAGGHAIARLGGAELDDVDSGWGGGRRRDLRVSAADAEDHRDEERDRSKHAVNSNAPHGQQLKADLLVHRLTPFANRKHPIEEGVAPLAGLAAVADGEYQTCAHRVRPIADELRKTHHELAVADEHANVAASVEVKAGTIDQHASVTIEDLELQGVAGGEAARQTPG